MTCCPLNYSRPGLHNESCALNPNYDALATLRAKLAGTPAHTEGYGEVTFMRTDGRTIVVDNVRVDSIGTDANTIGVVSMEIDGQDAPLHMPFIESWTIHYRF